ncbi:MAG TPA: ABC transporter permease [Burkholderiales bacterium]|nr:ABC transporter permease [Burkholderiales bacterium]
MTAGARGAGMLATRLAAFLRRDLREALSYKFTFISSFAGILFSTATFYFVAKLVPPGTASLGPFGGDYFSFAVVGVAFASLLGMFQAGLPAVIRSAQVSGTLEAVLLTPVSVSTVLVGSSLYALLFQVVRTALHLALAVLVFGMRLGPIDWPGAAAVFGLTALCFLSVGILSASFILVYKLGNPFDWILAGVSGLLGGMVFPVKLLPPWLRWVSSLLPVTYALDGMRRSLLAAAGFAAVVPDIVALAVFNAVLLPLSLLAFRAALRKARRDGTLTHY